MGNGLGDASEVKQALAKAEECARLAASAKTLKDRDYYDRMCRKWLGIADGWRVIDELDKVS
jgi:3-methyladenine DNA glycosylase AlkD